MFSRMFFLQYYGCYFCVMSGIVCMHEHYQISLIGHDT